MTQKSKGTVLQVMSIRHTKYGGVERFNVELASQLHRKGIASIFVSEAYPDTQAYVDDLREAGGEIQVISSKNLLLFSLRICWLILSRRVKWVHSHFAPANHIALWLAKFLGIRNIYMTLHSCIPPRERMKKLTRVVHDIDFSWAKIIAVSKAVERIVREGWPSTDVQTLYLGVNQIKGNRVDCRCALGLSQEDFILLSVGNRNYVKGFDLLCEAAARMQDELRYKKAKILIVGQEPKDLAETQEEVLRLGISDLILQTGITNRVADYVCASDVYVQCSRTEALSLSLLEACSFGLPLVATQVGGMPEIVQEGRNGWLVAPDNIESLEESLRQILEEENLSKFARESLQIYQSFELTSNVSKYVDMYLSS